MKLSEFVHLCVDTGWFMWTLKKNESLTLINFIL